MEALAADAVRASASPYPGIVHVATAYDSWTGGTL